MKNNLEKIGKIEAIGLLITIMVNQIIFNLPSIIILSTSTGAWINAIYIGVLAVLFVLLICKLFKPFVNKDIIDISEYVGGKTLKIIMCILFMVFFLLIASAYVRYFANSLKLIYFHSTPIIFLLLVMIIGPVIINKIGLKAISGVNIIFVPLIVVGIVILLLSTSQDFVPERLFPILGNGIDSVFLSGTTNIYAFLGLAYLYFFPAFLKEPKDFKKISIISITFSGIYLFLSVLSLLMSFSFVVLVNEFFSIYLLTRMVELRQIF